MAVTLRLASMGCRGLCRQEFVHLSTALNVLPSMAWVQTASRWQGMLFIYTLFAIQSFLNMQDFLQQIGLLC